MKIFILLCICISVWAAPLLAQEVTVTGKVTDASTGDPVPFVNVFFKGTSIGSTTDFDGYYRIKTTSPQDSLVASYIGYIKRMKYVGKAQSQQVNFQLEPDITKLEEVVFLAGENPAFEVLRRVVKNKSINDKRSLSAYEYQSYNKIEIDVDNISDKMKKKKIMQKITMVMDSIERVAGEDGKPVLPIFISEALSSYYFRDSPRLQRELIQKTKVTGVGVTDGNTVSQLLGSSFQEYNFYQNWLNILEKEFVSPIADGWKLYYNYDLMDSLFVGDHLCYRIEVRPKRVQDLAFNGTIWITTESYALKQVDLSISKDANLNYIDKIKIQQELQETEAGAWLPVKTRVLVDVGEVTKNTAGMLAKFYSSNKDFIINKPRGVKFYETSLEVAEDAKIYKKGFWEENRHDSLTETEKNVYIMIDTLKSIPMVKSYLEVMNILVNGYKRVGKVDVGPYIYAYANNNIEGHRVRVGFKSNINFSNKWIFRGYLAYGFGDQEFKYGASARYILSRKRWTTIGIERKRDIEQVGLLAEDLEENNYIFYAFSNFGQLIRPFINTQNKFTFQREIRKGFTQKVGLVNKTFDPRYDFQFYRSPGVENAAVANSYTATEINVETRLSKGEVFLQDDNDRISLGSGTKPIFTINYTMGVKGLLGSDFDYHKVSMHATQRVKFGFLGVSRYTISAGHIFSQLPYPLLKVHIGNESPFYTSAAYNLMNNFEFVSDSYASLRYNHYFEGFILNSIPLIKKLKWRLVGTANVLFGSVRQENIDIIPEGTSAEGEPYRFNALSPGKPYVELGYGIENIFKVVRIDAFHRLTYLNNPEASKFGIKIYFQFIL